MSTDSNFNGAKLYLLNSAAQTLGCDLVLPQNNFIGTILFARLLDAKLETAGQLLAPTTFSGPLNRSCFVCSVTDAHEAAQSIRSFLESAALASSARLYRWDQSELIFRNLHPAGGDDVLPEEFLGLFMDCESSTVSAIEKHAQLEKGKSNQTAV